MEGKGLILFFLSFLILSLFFRELPYVNLFLAGRLWLFYALLLLLLFFVWQKKYFSSVALILLGMGFLAGSFVLALLNFPDFAETLGVGTYFLLWLALIWKIINLLKTKEGK